MAQGPCNIGPKNSVVDAINASLLAEVGGEAKTYQSVDTVCDPEEAVAFPTEFLNSLNVSGLPPHQLELRVGAPIMLLRNLGKFVNITHLSKSML